MPSVPYLLYRKEFMKMSDNNNNAKTMYEAVPAAAELNKVPGFDPLKFLRRAEMCIRDRLCWSDGENEKQHLEDQRIFSIVQTRCV